MNSKIINDLQNEFNFNYSELIKKLNFELIEAYFLSLKKPEIFINGGFEGVGCVEEEESLGELVGEREENLQENIQENIQENYFQNNQTQQQNYPENHQPNHQTTQNNQKLNNSLKTISFKFGKSSNENKNQILQNIPQPAQNTLLAKLIENNQKTEENALINKKTTEIETIKNIQIIDEGEFIQNKRVETPIIEELVEPKKLESEPEPENYEIFTNQTPTARYSILSDFNENLIASTPDNFLETRLSESNQFYFELKPQADNEITENHLNIKTIKEFNPPGSPITRIPNIINNQTTFLNQTKKIIQPKPKLEIKALNSAALLMKKDKEQKDKREQLKIIVEKRKEEAQRKINIAKLAQNEQLKREKQTMMNNLKKPPSIKESHIMKKSVVVNNV